MNQILKIDNLILSFNGINGKVPAVKGVDLEIFAGETLALVGESGCGKTALCRAVMMLHNRHAEIEKGRIMLLGKEVTKMTEGQLEHVRGKDAAMIFQDPMSSLNPTLSIGKQIMEPMMIHEKLSKSKAKDRALKLLQAVEIDHPNERFKQYPHHLSGGMRQRAAIAIALACTPKLIIADEPTTALDIATQKKIMELLKRLCVGEEKAMLFVTHDLGLAETAADRIAVMKDGAIVEMGKTEDIFNSPQHEYTKKLLGFARYGKSTSHFHGALNDGKTAKSEEILVSVRSLTKIFEMGKKRKTAVKDFSVDINRGEILGLVGQSGCGKSTLARCMMGIYRPTAGEILIKEGVRKQMIFQDSASAFNPRMTIEKIIAEPLIIKNRRRDRKEILEKVYDVMEQVGLEKELAGRHPYDVSGGQRQRAAIARALITDPDFLVADEPIASLDVSIQSQIVHLLKKLHDERNLTILLISHDLPMVEHVSDRIISLESFASSAYNSSKMR